MVDQNIREDQDRDEAGEADMERGRRDERPMQGQTSREEESEEQSQTKPQNVENKGNKKPLDKRGDNSGLRPSQRGQG